MINANEFQQLTPHLTAARRAQILPPLQAAMQRFAINTYLRECHFLAQLLEESGQFRWERELASGAEYEGRHDLGNTHPGDGARYKGRGWIQITGRANYRTYGKLLGLDLENNPALAETDTNAALIAGAYWNTHGLNSRADRDDVVAITRAINGGLNGLSVREANLAMCKRVLSRQDTAIQVFVNGVEVEGAGAYQDTAGGVWARLRLIVDRLPGWSIKTAAEPRAILQRGTEEVPVPMKLDSEGRGFSPVGPLCEMLGLAKSWDGKSVRIG